MHKEPSAVSQVFEWLAATYRTGDVLYSHDAHAALPHLDPSHISAALSLLSSRQYLVLERLPRERGRRPYRVTEYVRRGWHGHARPERRGGERRGREPSPPPQANTDAYAHAEDAALEAAVCCNQRDRERALEKLREAYWTLKNNQLPEAC